MAKDMTTGSPPRLLLEFALPLLAGNVLQQAYNLIDSAIVGKVLGVNALAGVGATGSIQFFVFGCCMGTCLGFSIPIAQNFGAANWKKVKEYFFHAVLLTIVIGLVTTCICATNCHNILRLMSTPEDIYQSAYDYLVIIFLGIPFTLLYNLLSSCLRSIGDSKTPFVFLAFSTCLNIVLDFVCILVFKMGVSGAAFATIVAQAVSGILCLIFIIKQVDVLHLERENMKIYLSDIKNLLFMGIPMGLQFSINAIGSMVTQVVNNGLGSLYVSGCTIGTRIGQLITCPFEALASAISVFSSQNFGAEKPKRIKQGFVYGIGMGIGYGIFAGVILFCFGKPLSLLFVTKDSVEVIDVTAQFLKYYGATCWALSLVMSTRMCTQGLGYAGRAVFSGFFEMLARVVISMTLVDKFGYTAVCLANPMAWIIGSLYMLPMCIYTIRTVTNKKAVLEVT